MSFLKRKTRSTRVRFYAAFVAAIAMLFGGSPMASAEVTAVTADVRFEWACGEPEANLVFSSSEEMAISIDFYLERRSKDGALSDEGYANYWLYSSTEERTFDIFPAFGPPQFADGTTKVWWENATYWQINPLHGQYEEVGPLPEVVGSEFIDCRDYVPPGGVIQVPSAPVVVDDPDVKDDWHYELPADTDVFDWTLNPDGSVTVIIKTNDTFPDGSTSHTYPVLVDVFNDEDGDGYGDGVDQCLGTAPGATVDVNGCSWEQRDDDHDGVRNGLDDCQDTAPGADADANGCSWEQRDDDGDGVPNGADNCADTPAGEIANSSGCSPSQVDSDGDGVFDSVDSCVDQPGSAENGGCPVVNPDVTYLDSGKIGKICQTAKGCKTTIVVNHLAGQAPPTLTAELSSGKTLTVKPRRENTNAAVYTISFPKGVAIVSVSAVLPNGAQLH